MDFIKIIEDKKLGKELTEEEIRLFSDGAAKKTVPDYQLAALLMAIRLNGMSDHETERLTMAMAESGDRMTPDVGGPALDKHSTGGVGDTTTLILAPLVAACGGKVVKMSGRGLGHTGGTLDKLESIPGLTIDLSEEDILRIAREVGCVVAGQTGELAPADKTLYALRDVTSTVDCIPLIAASILSKKFAGGAHSIVLDVKTGSGAMMQTMEDALKLAQTMVRIGDLAGREVRAVISGMDEPLGSHVGNALQVKEAIDVLSGRVDGPLKEVSLFLGSQMLLLGGLAKNETEARKMLNQALNDGSGLEKLREMIVAQKGDATVCDDVTKLPQAKYIKDVKIRCEGYVCKMDTTALGLAARDMGAGRILKTDVIDPAVGFVMKKRIGDAVHAGDTLCTLFASREADLEQAGEKILQAVKLQKEPCPPMQLLKALVTREGTVFFDKE